MGRLPHEHGDDDESGHERRADVHESPGVARIFLENQMAFETRFLQRSPFYKKHALSAARAKPLEASSQGQR